MAEGGMIEVGKATVTIVPNMKGAQATISGDLDSITGTAGKSAGAKLGASLSGAASKVLIAGGIGAAVGMALKGSYEAWNELDDAMDVVAQKTGATGDALEDMKDRAQQLAQDIPVSFADAGEAIGEINTRFGATGDELSALSENFLKFAKINGTNVSDSVDSVSKAMAAFGLETEDTARVLDALNAVGQRTGVDVGKLSQLLSANAAQFSEMGLSVEEAAAFLGQADMAGLESTQMLAGLRTAMKKATDEGISMSDELENFQGIMESNASESDKLAAAYEIFGTRAGAAIYNAVKNGTMDLENFGASIEGFEGSVSSTFEESMDPIDKFTSMLNSLKVVGAEAFTALLTIAEPVIDFLASALQALAALVQGDTEKARDIIISAFEPLLNFFQNLWNNIVNSFREAGVRIGNAIGGAFKAAINAVLATAERILNNPINAINAVLSILNAIPGVNIGMLPGISLPRMATGGIVTRPTIAQIGEAGPEAVIPLTSMAGGIGTTYNVYIDGIKYNTDEYIDSSVRGFVQNVFRLGQTFSR